LLSFATSEVFRKGEKLTVDEATLQAFGRLLRETRENARMSVADLAKRLGLSTATIYNWQQGRFKPDQGTLVRLAEIFGDEFAREAKYAGIEIKGDWGTPSPDNPDPAGGDEEQLQLDAAEEDDGEEDEGEVVDDGQTISVGPVEAGDPIPPNSGAVVPINAPPVEFMALQKQAVLLLIEAYAAAWREMDLDDCPDPEEMLRAITVAGLEVADMLGPRVADVLDQARRGVLP
jgi:transcriptional regulator with XRE-family HTH domain